MTQSGLSSWTIAGRNRLGGHSGVGSEGEMISVCAGFDDGGEDLTWEPALPVTPTGGGFQVVSDCGDLHGPRAVHRRCRGPKGVRKVSCSTTSLLRADISDALDTCERSLLRGGSDRQPPHACA